jgi:Family of unknown function (DUF6345)/FlgD Ig-like domain/Bacterial Ig domain
VRLCGLWGKTIGQKKVKTMKTIMGCAVMAITAKMSAQTNLQFTSVNATPERAIQLHWQSNSNEIYEIDYADALIDTNTGSITWNKLYDDYTSQGTNTFVADAGNYDLVPEIPHPKLSPMRFYRVILTGTNSSPTNPTVAVIFPTNGASLSGDVVFSVASSSPEALTDVKLYIDGEAQWRSDDGTNFLINTCEWPNGAHTIFAVARSQSAIEGFSYNYPITYGSAASSYVNVTFDNLISRFDFSQPYFEPSLGQTQQVTAAFAANSDWTLQILDASSNVVRTTTGSGDSMEFDWDGTGDGEAAIPDGVYTYLLSAQTNGQPDEEVVVGGGSGGGSPPSPSMAETDSAKQLWATDDSENILPLAIYPPGFDTNGLTIFEATPSEIQSLKAPALQSKSSVAMVQSISFSPDVSNSSAYPSNQSTHGPKRKPRVGVKNASGTFGICYKTYPNGFFSQEPTTGRIYPLQPIFTGTDGRAPQSGYIPWSTLKSFKDISDGFNEIMKIGFTNGTYKPAFIKANEDWGPQDIQKSSLGGHSIFNTCNFGLLMTHGVAGTQPEIDGIKYTYLALFDNVHHNSYVRLSDMDFGSTGANGLRWMTILSCNMLAPANITSMANHSILPDNDDLHLLLGATTVTYAIPTFGVYYATNLLFNTPIWNSFQDAGQVSYNEAHQNPILAPQMTNTVTFRVMGYQSCIGDRLFLYNDPDPNTSYQIINSTVFTPSP